MEVSNCCGASFYEPGWPDNDICSSCKEHADVIEQEEPSIKVIEMPTEISKSAMDYMIKNNIHLGQHQSKIKEEE
tara:strand:- start:258 stop:482 length:225 start_codon:yes stop_codon:yes gene_type:complete